MIKSFTNPVWVKSRKWTLNPSQTKILEFYAPQTKILEGWTKDEILIFEWTFNFSWPKSSTHALEKCFEKSNFIFCSSFQNLRLGGVNFKIFVWEHIMMFPTWPQHKMDPNRPSRASNNSKSSCTHSFCKCLADIRPFLNGPPCDMRRWWCSVETGTLDAHAGIDASALTRRRGVAWDVDVVDE